MLPTARAAWILAGFAPVALVIAAAQPRLWVIAPIAALALIALIICDALLAARLESWQVSVPEDSEVGRKTAIAVHAQLARGAVNGARASLALDPRLGASGRAVVHLESIHENDRFRADFAVRPLRRGTAQVTRAWLRWAGPLGLGARQAQRELGGAAMRIWPDLTPTRSPELQTFLRDAAAGLIARRIRGEGTQFEALREYQPGMDRRQIDWKASARHTHLYARENESERNNQIVFAFDCGPAMCETVDGLPRIDRAVTAALTCAYVALKGGDKVALFGFAQRPRMLTPFAQNVRAFHRLQSAAASLDYEAAESNFTLALATLTAKLRRRSLIVLFSDFTDPTAAELMIESIGRLVERHLVLFVTIADSELEAFTRAPPGDVATLARAVTADSLLHQRQVVLQRLRHLGVAVVEAPHERIGYELIDRYFAIRNHEAIG
ncbi:hypothetical protein MACH05_25450 [Qipengyuania nanhaisediminis]